MGFEKQAAEWLIDYHEAELERAAPEQVAAKLPPAAVWIDPDGNLRGTENHKQLSLTCDYNGPRKLGDLLAKRTAREKRLGHMGFELLSSSHSQWHYLAHASRLLTAASRGDAVVLSDEREWWAGEAWLTARLCDPKEPDTVTYPCGRFQGWKVCSERGALYRSLQSGAFAAPETAKDPHARDAYWRKLMGRCVAIGALNGVELVEPVVCAQILEGRGERWWNPPAQVLLPLVRVTNDGIYDTRILSLPTTAPWVFGRTGSGAED